MEWELALLMIAVEHLHLLIFWGGSAFSEGNSVRPLPGCSFMDMKAEIVNPLFV
jgi:hypothetical protein